MPKPVIICDEQIPFAERTFSRIGPVRLLPASRINARSIRRGEVLIIRSVTRVNSDLLGGTRIKLVGSVTSGIDHIDTAYLKRRRIKMIAAPGSNAESVAEYVLASLVLLSRRKGFNLRGMSVGVIGVGHVGALVDRKLRALGLRTILNDPPLARATRDHRYRPLADVLAADIITLHVPLVTGGRYATYQMVDRKFLARLKRPVILVNTSRGRVLDERAVREYLGRKAIAGLVVDVWPHEPDIDADLISCCDIATPHIAGYSLDGKVRAVDMVFKGVCRAYGIRDPWSVTTMLKPPRDAVLKINGSGKDSESVIGGAVLKIYDPGRDDCRLRRVLAMDTRLRKDYFEHLRRTYPVRREFGQYRIVPASSPGSVKRTLVRLGFRSAISR